MERGKQRSRGQWEAIIDEQERGGLSASDYCRDKSIGLSSFYHWRRRLGDTPSGSRSAMDSPESFIDMGRIGSSGVSTPASVSPWVVTLDFGEGFKLTLQRS